nr:YopJ family acetyltransferase [Ralstonia solanacearum]
MRKDASGTSVIVVDPVAAKERNESAYVDYADNVNSEFGEEAKCAFIPVDIQKSFLTAGRCPRSLALKMQDKGDAFATLHDTLRNGGDPSHSACLGYFNYNDLLGNPHGNLQRPACSKEQA